MKLFEAIKSALSVINSHRLRSALTILGIIIGISGIIAMMSMGDGAKKLLLAEVEKAGGPTLFGVYRAEFLDTDGKQERNRSKHHLTTEDLERIRTDCPSVATAIPEVDSGASVSARGEQRNASMKATTMDFQNLRKWHSEVGRFISDEDVSLWQKTCVIGTKVLNELFDGINPIGRELKINNERFTVVGVMESQGQEAAENGDDNRVIIPFTTAQARFWGAHRRIPHIVIEAKSIDLVEQAMDEVRLVMLRNHGGEPFFRMWSMKKEMESANKIIFYIEMVLVIIAAVALVVAGIGILNIMLVSVTERIKEVGLRKAIGAKRRDIRLQFLTEAVILCLIGSVGGIVLGAVIGHGFSWAISTFLIKDAVWPSVISVDAIGKAVLVSTVLGIFFGYYPAGKAAKLPPIEALRHQ